MAIQDKLLLRCPLRKPLQPHDLTRLNGRLALTTNREPWRGHPPRALVLVCVYEEQGFLIIETSRSRPEVDRQEADWSELNDYCDSPPSLNH